MRNGLRHPGALQYGLFTLPGRALTQSMDVEVARPAVSCSNCLRGESVKGNISEATRHTVNQGHADKAWDKIGSGAVCSPVLTAAPRWPAWRLLAISVMCCVTCWIDTLRPLLEVDLDCPELFRVKGKASCREQAPPLHPQEPGAGDPCHRGLGEWRSCSDSAPEPGAAPARC